MITKNKTLLTLAQYNRLMLPFKVIIEEHWAKLSSVVSKVDTTSTSTLTQEHPEFQVETTEHWNEVPEDSTTPSSIAESSNVEFLTNATRGTLRIVKREARNVLGNVSLDLDTHSHHFFPVLILLVAVVLVMSFLLARLLRHNRQSWRRFHLWEKLRVEEH